MDGPGQVSHDGPGQVIAGVMDGWSRPSYSWMDDPGQVSHVIS